MPDVSDGQILEALKTVKDPDKGDDIVSLGMVSGVVNRNGNVGFSIEVDAARGAKLEPMRKAAEDAVIAINGVLSVTAVMTAPTATPGAAAQSSSGPAPGQNPAPRAKLLENIGAVIAVASGKGGVGKSTTSVNLALALSQLGHRTGILDADIYGPSLPLMMGITEKPDSPDGKRLSPIEKFGIKCMSIGFMVPADTPMIWRGPMVMGALEQMMGDVDWGNLDVLIVDMPPGTGDAQLTMAQRVALAGAVIVSTPQDLALLDARKGLNMFRRVDVPVLGIIENMSYFLCPHCGERSDIFTHGGARKAAAQMGVDFLGEVPLDMAIREGSDMGRPIVAADPDSDHAKTYRAIAEALWNTLGDGASRPSAPKIIME
ncbi:MAG: Mrp/NBP35 family ATP-binding protein [Proteobacteria bacterium]|nr:Mrp/NBP35 family ATP-binding protein [Pseudomonadota bacterium]MDA1324185.1 Mrp/NBP35 family ATP-binding protein [Pseudomonadota bacterium]